MIIYKNLCHIHYLAFHHMWHDESRQAIKVGNKRRAIMEVRYDTSLTFVHKLHTKNLLANMREVLMVQIMPPSSRRPLFSGLTLGMLKSTKARCW